MSDNFWVNLLGFQLLWWLCILYGNSVDTWVILLILLHLIFHPQPKLEAGIILITALVGFSVDLFLTLNGVFNFESSSLLPPYWLFLLWLGFCCTLRQSLVFFSGKYLLAGCVGALAGSSTYLAAAGLGAVELGMPWINVFMLLALIWALLFPLLLYISDSVEAYFGGQHA